MADGCWALEMGDILRMVFQWLVPTSTGAVSYDPFLDWTSLLHCARVNKLWHEYAIALIWKGEMSLHARSRLV